jgi:uridine monophosphate synthetase
MQELKHHHGFLLIEDRKFADIGAISLQQLERLPTCFDMVTVHAIAGQPALAELDKRGIGLLVVCQMSSAGNLLDKNYQTAAVAMTGKLNHAVGAVAQEAQPQLLTFTPGINIDTDVKRDAAGQQYKPPSATSGDLFIVGRGICAAPDPAAAALLYRTQCWAIFANQPTPTSKL